jgi:4-amino-4-deoxy-L-arabinose transferase-like glycosyltransferase
MERSLAERFLGSDRTLWMTGAWICLLFVSTNLPWQLDDYDQAKQAFTSFQMVREADWLYQRLPEEFVAQKPPFVGWISAVVYEVTRSWDLAWRLPSLLSAVAISILLLRASGSAYGPIAGLISLSAFGLNLLSARLSTLVTTDMPLALSIFLLGLLIWQKIRKAEPWNSLDRWWVFALLTVSMLIKGPIVYAFLLPGIAALAWRAHKDKITNAWSGWWPWVGSLAVFLLWVAGGILFKPGFYDQVVIREFLGRFSETVHRPQPVYFYLPHLLHKFAPWSVLMILLAVALGRQTRGRMREAFRNLSPDIFWLLCWSLGGLIVMSLVPSKRVDRIFPVVPPLCLLLGTQVARGLAAERMRRRVYQWSAAALLCSFLFTTGYTVWKVVPGYAYHRDALVTFSQAVRRKAAARHWRYEVVSSRDVGGTGGMLLYLQKLHFIPLTEATEKWNSDQIEALVIPNDQVDAAMAMLRQASIAPLRTLKRKNLHAPTYFLVTRLPRA